MMLSFIQKLLGSFKTQPLIWLGALATAVLAFVKSLAGDGLISGDVLNWFVNYLDPQNGYVFIALTVILGWFRVTPVK